VWLYWISRFQLWACSADGGYRCGGYDLVFISCTTSASTVVIHRPLARPGRPGVPGLPVSRINGDLVCRRFVFLGHSCSKFLTIEGVIKIRDNAPP